LRVTRGVDLGRICEVSAAPVTIGAAPDNTLCLSDRHVSRAHCQVFTRDGQCVIRDLGSTNGTHLDGVLVVEALLPLSARIGLGMTELTLELLTPAPKTRSSAPEVFSEMVGRSKAMRQVFSALHSVAQSSLTCLLLGETGTGKELAAKALHEHSQRPAQPFLVVDCASVGPQFIEDKLFGHQRGAFTGASSAVAGVFEEARGGSVFLDEIGELPMALQPKLLGVLERREATRIGSHTPIKLDFRLIAATHRNLPEMVRQGQFRQDLLYRISEFTLRIPALRERKEDIGLIAEAVLRREGYSRTLANDAIEYLQSLPWPGNIRELRNMMRRAAVLARGAIIDRRLLEELDTATSEIEIPEELALGSPLGLRSTAVSIPTPPAADQHSFELPLADAVEAFRKAYLQSLRHRFGNDLNAAAAHAGVHPKSVSRLFRIYGVHE
jgi:DNA-binding NtrC family response regulator